MVDYQPVPHETATAWADTYGPPPPGGHTRGLLAAAIGITIAGAVLLLAMVATVSHGVWLGDVMKIPVWQGILWTLAYALLGFGMGWTVATLRRPPLLEERAARR